MLLGRNAELGGSEVWHRGAGRLVEGYLSTLLPCHNNEARERARQSDGAAYRRCRFFAEFFLKLLVDKVVLELLLLVWAA